MKHLVVISAPSGAGKTTLCQRLLTDYTDRLVLSVSCTSRAPRGQEEHTKHYYFLSKAEFEAKIRDGDFAEWAVVHGNYYGTSKSVIRLAFSAGKSVLLDIDVQGAASLRLAYPDHCLTVFVAPPSLEVLEARLRARGTESSESIAERMENARVEMAEQSKFNAVIINDELERAYAELLTIVEPILGSPSRGGRPPHGAGLR